MITTLTKSRTGRILLIPIVILCGAYSWWSYVDGTQNTQDAGRLKSWWGWLDPKLDPEWARFGTDPTFHLLKNMGSEWARTDPQRAYKAFSFALVLFTLMTAIAVALLWWAL